MFKYLAFLVLLVPQLSIAEPVENNETAQEMLVSAREAWEGHDLQDYTFILERGGVFGRLKYRVKVKAGKCVKVTYWRRLIRHHDSCENRTIPDLLDELGQVIQNDPVSIWLEFDPEFGFPVYVAVEPRTDLTDQDWGYVISKFRDQGQP